MSVYRCARCGFAYDPSLPSCYKCQLPRGAPWNPQPPAQAQPQPQQFYPPQQAYPPQQPYPPQQSYPPQQPYPPQAQPPTQPQAPQGNFDHLWYGTKLNIPTACSCCMGPAQTSVASKWMRTGGRTAARVAVPYCSACKLHRTWSGHFGVGFARFLGPLFAAGGITGGVLLGLAMTKDGGNTQQYAAVLSLVFAIVGFAVALLLVGAIGRAVAPSTPQCSCRGDAVQITRGRGAWQFRFTNRQFEHAFRSMNQGRTNEY